MGLGGRAWKNRQSKEKEGKAVQVRGTAEAEGGGVRLDRAVGGCGASVGSAGSLPGQRGSLNARKGFPDLQGHALPAAGAQDAFTPGASPESPP